MLLKNACKLDDNHHDLRYTRSLKDLNIHYLIFPAKSTVISRLSIIRKTSCNHTYNSLLLITYALGQR
jgi:hypothetical protein